MDILPETHSDVESPSGPILTNPRNAFPPPKPKPERIREFLGAKMRPGDVAELRIVKAQFAKGGYVEPSQYRTTLSGWYDRHDALTADACRCRGVSPYITVNPVDPALLARSDNKLIRAEHASNKDDILCLRWVFVDIDPIRKADISSTDEELALAVERRDAILDGEPKLADSAL